MKVIIEIERNDLEPERVLDYFYFKCLDEPVIGGGKFNVEIEGTQLKKEHKK